MQLDYYNKTKEVGTGISMLKSRNIKTTQTIICGL